MDHARRQLRELAYSIEGALAEALGCLELYDDQPSPELFARALKDVTTFRRKM
jgi:hypothetical protein